METKAQYITKPALPPQLTKEVVIDRLIGLAEDRDGATVEGDRFSGIVTVITADGWVFQFFMDCGELDYVSAATSPMGGQMLFAEWGEIDPLEFIQLNLPDAFSNLETWLCEDEPKRIALFEGEDPETIAEKLLSLYSIDLLRSVIAELVTI